MIRVPSSMSEAAAGDSIGSCESSLETAQAILRAEEAGCLE
jgi:hypothetical protein